MGDVVGSGKSGCEMIFGAEVMFVWVERVGDTINVLGLFSPTNGILELTLDGTWGMA